uniref:Putative phosphatidylinositol-4-phosphate 5-kinase n=1 Tax=uncultured bacterium A1Q1_fos_504 TaxID=1256580 RepID=L7VWF7_9BACT|nr:putative phosphatidylinositol-4-phosphate 5-kinase [uncultured bacterium A1Q1_fos_504]
MNLDTRINAFGGGTSIVGVIREPSGADPKADIKPDGIGRLELENGDFYEGEFKDGMFDGKGRLKMKDGKLYEGTWSMNMREGQGKELWLDGKSYEGSFKRDQKNGYGKKPLPKLTPRCLQVARWKLIHRLLQRR